ncbi:MAG TPA: type I-U CRISPR-associated protein Cas8c [Candidatus Hydrogenedentes bacterium]|nr:type I-U CRISPR-associated protein Cas8c [Candidatus Hydrogenedentota bacterium]
MKWPDPTFSVKVNVTNPGQFFACCGLLELAHRLWHGAEGWFDEDELGPRFCVRALFSASARLNQVVEALLTCKISGLSDEAQEELKRLQAEEKRLRKEGRALPKDEELRLKELGNQARAGGLYLGAPFSLTLDWWQVEHDESSPKTWAGQQKPHKMARAAQEAIADINDAESLFDFPCVLRTPPEYSKNKSDKGKPVEPFCFDARRFAHALDTGFSLDVQDVETRAYPAVELLALIGLQRCLPASGSTRWALQYAVWSHPVSPPVAAAITSRKIRGSTKYEFQLLFRDDQKRYKAFGFAFPVGD